MARKKPFDLGEELEGRLIDFCEAHYGASQVRVVREALVKFIAEQLESEPELRQRYEAARKARLGKSDSNIQLVKPLKE